MSQPLKYVVLRHEGVDDPHFDLMVETERGSDLWTWRTYIWPPVVDAEFTRLRDHRRAYLEYEGPIAADKGWVSRVAGGECNLAVSPSVPPAVRIVLSGEIAMDFVLEHIGPRDRWRAKWISA
jgi:hypothetical protein